MADATIQRRVLDVALEYGESGVTVPEGCKALPCFNCRSVRHAMRRLRDAGLLKPEGGGRGRGHLSRYFAKAGAMLKPDGRGYRGE